MKNSIVIKMTVKTVKIGLKDNTNQRLVLNTLKT